MNPTFIGVGPARCGTTSVYHYLKQHPQVFMSAKKEMNFFSYQRGRSEIDAGRADLHDPVTSWGEYQELFGHAGAARAAGEISPSYFWWPGVAEGIHRTLPEARIFCILRNPIDRAYSSYRMHVDNGGETRTFDQVVKDELKTPTQYPWAAGNYYVRIGFYARHLAPFVALFRPHKLKICFYDDLESSPARFMRELFEFIGVDPDFVVDTSSRFNTLGVRRMEQALQARRLGGLLKQIRRVVPQALYHRMYRSYSASAAARHRVPPMPAEIRARLIDAYAEDLRALEQLSGRDLSQWLRA